MKGARQAKRWGKPEELIGAAVFLASPASNYGQRPDHLCRWRHAGEGFREHYGAKWLPSAVKKMRQNKKIEDFQRDSENAKCLAPQAALAADRSGFVPTRWPVVRYGVLTRLTSKDSAALLQAMALFENMLILVLVDRSSCSRFRAGSPIPYPTMLALAGVLVGRCPGRADIEIDPISRWCSLITRRCSMPPMISRRARGAASGRLRAWPLSRWC